MDNRLLTKAGVTPGDIRAVAPGTREPEAFKEISMVVSEAMSQLSQRLEAEDATSTYQTAFVYAMGALASWSMSPFVALSTVSSVVLGKIIHDHIVHFFPGLAPEGRVPSLQSQTF